MKTTNITQTYEYNFAPISLSSVRNSSAKRLDRNVTTGSKLKTNNKESVISKVSSQFYRFKDVLSLIFLNNYLYLISPTNTKYKLKNKRDYCIKQKFT